MPGKNGYFNYNTNGSLTSDSGRGIVTIEYNSLNLPKLIQFNNGNQVQYIYASDGQKLRAKHITAKQGVVQPVTNGQIRELKPSEILSVLQTDYVGNTVLTTEGEQGVAPLAEYKVLFGNGYDKYVLTDTKKLTYDKKSHYQLTDYLGNIRSTKVKGQALEVTEYHAFGTPFRRFKGEMSSDPYKHGGKEFDRMHGLNWYDFHARQYDPVLARFHTMDPMAEKYYNISPYAYCANNPVRRIDPTGKSWGDVFYGVTDAITENLSWGVVKGGSVNNVSDAGHYNSGRSIGDLASMAMGAIETIQGGIATIGGAVATATGVGAAVGVPAVVAGTIETTHGVGVIIKATQGNGRVSEANKFDGGKSTDNITSREALRNAKDQNGVPRSQQPNKTTSVPDKNTGKPLKQYEYTNSKGEKVTVRKDNPVTYPDGGSQGKHYNAGKVDDETDKLKQHHNYEK